MMLTGRRTAWTERTLRTIGTAVALLVCSSLAGAPVHAQPSDESKPAVVRDGGNVWYLRDSLTSGTATRTFRYGDRDEEGVRLMGDWDGDGVRTPGIVRGTTWFLRNENSSGVADVTFSVTGVRGVPIAGDWDGDGKDTPAHVQWRYDCREEPNGEEGCRYSTRWFLRNSNSPGGADTVVDFPEKGTPISGDWDGDGRDGIGLVRFGGWSWILGETGDGDLSDHDRSFTYGVNGDRPVVGDWDGDGRDEPGAVRGNRWFLKHDLSGGHDDHRFRYGLPGDHPRSWR